MSDVTIRAMRKAIGMLERGQVGSAAETLRQALADALQEADARHKHEVSKLVEEHMARMRIFDLMRDD